MDYQNKNFDYKLIKPSQLTKWPNIKDPQWQYV